MAPTLLLASNSPRRRQLLSLAGWTFNIRPADLDETPWVDELPPSYVLRLAESKARAASAFAQSGQIILAADTTVVDGDSILGKPADAGEAQKMLTRLRSRAHTVYTAICAYDPQTGRCLTDLCATQVWMRNYSDEELADYIASGDPFDKAGAYAIQNQSFHPVERISGCYPNVVGLPVCRVNHLLEQLGLAVSETDRANCQAHLSLERPCSFYENVLRDDEGGRKFANQ